FDRNHVHPDWPRDQLDKRYCAEVAGMNFALNVLHLELDTDRSGKPMIAQMVPRMPWLTPEEELTAKGGRNTAIGVRRSPGRNDLVIYGNVTEPVGADVTLSRMPLNFARLLEDRLKQAGVRAGKARVVALTEASPLASTADSREILRITTPIAKVVERCNTNSQNLHAECLLKSVGHEVELAPGSWENGSRAVRMLVVERLGPEHASSFHQADGSGMSRKNRITAETTTAWLASFREDPRLGSLFVESLADPRDAGTIKRRFDDLPAGVELACKTGYIRGVSCLSGLLSVGADQCYAFSILCNDIPARVGVAGAKRLQERIVDLLASDLLNRQTALGGE
ncbi:MAG: D-alanyl-D-alanine carboxypeptidase, partial [Planctomycetota bacterium]|nr:D-alanyl-D-alanine carboxypeptidase [Planctomycetota bacterium]